MSKASQKLAAAIDNAKELEGPIALFRLAGVTDEQIVTRINSAITRVRPEKTTCSFCGGQRRIHNRNGDPFDMGRDCPVCEGRGEIEAD